MRAAVLWEYGAPFDVRADVEHRSLRPHEVLVRIRSAGVCASDLSLAAGTFGQPLPAVLGHEGAGEVTEVGDQVRSVSVGDHVVVCWVPPCGRCPACRRGDDRLCSERRGSKQRGQGPADAVPDLRVGEQAVLRGMDAGTFAEECVLSEAGVVRIDRDVPFPVAAFLGCAVPTGVGAALRSAVVQPGDTVFVIGCGAVGLNAVMAAALAGAASVVAVDPMPARRDFARTVGATDAVGPEELGEATKSTGRGFDVGIDAVGSSGTIRQGWDALRRGGTLAVVGAGRLDDQVVFSAYEVFHDEKKLTGSFYGGFNMHRDLDFLVSLWRSGRVPVERLLDRTEPLEAINDVVAAQRRGEVVRVMLTL
ncbi:MAG TPA: alcohol dehydrogenase catalytic domain-containing protein [Acidimicrobiia bacterium]|jgi:S-(hydroxymethyl)glutathione dehydrogenase/alcohol dehydrogenase|nr:alcohol dehydrogenase catalytic domain-containing protein [Acidimicrobiia bacterium]